MEQKISDAPADYEGLPFANLAQICAHVDSLKMIAVFGMGKEARIFFKVLQAKMVA